MDAVVADPPYGMNKAEWDTPTPEFIQLIKNIPTAIFCGVIGMRDYPPADWVGAWVRQSSTQRNGALKGFNNWEPILFYNIKSLSNDVISCPNYRSDYDHPTVKPIRLMIKLVSLMPEGTLLDPFMGTGTTGAACANLGRPFIGIEREAKYFDMASERIDIAQRQKRLFD